MPVPFIKQNVNGQTVPFSVFLNGAIVTTVPLQAGDFVAFLDYVSMGNIAVTEDPAGSGELKLAPTQAMTNGSILLVKCHDQTIPAAWEDRVLIFAIDTKTVGELATQSEILSDATPFPGGNIDDAISNKLDASAYTTPPTVGAIDAQLIGSHGAGLWGGGAGTGVITFTYSLTYTNPSPPPATLPIDGALIWVTTDALGTNRVAQGLTDAFGEVVFYLDPGTYYFWRAKDGYVFSNPDIEVVS